MSLWDKVKSGARSLWSGVKNLFNSGDTYTDTVSKDKTNDDEKQTLNQQIANGNINTTTNINNNVNQTVKQTNGFDLVKEKINNATTPIDTTTIQDNTPTQVADKEEEGFWSKVGNWFKGAKNDVVDSIRGFNNRRDNFVDQLDKSAKIDKDYGTQEKLFAVGYDPDSRNVYYLDLNEDRGFSDMDLGTRDGVRDRFDELYGEAYQKILDGGNSLQAFQDFYNQAKEERLFRLRAEDRYSNGGKRRDEMYTQEQLDTLSKSGKTKKGIYEDITFDEFLDFLNMYDENRVTQADIVNKYNELYGDAEQIAIDSGTQSDWMAKERDIALKNIDTMLEPMNIVNPRAATEARLTYSSTVLGNTLSRWYAHVSGIYRAEQEILNRDQSTRSEYDKQLLADAEVARQMDKQFAQNVNDLFRQILLYGTNKDGEIVNTPDMFENGESLNQVLNKGLRELAGEDDHFYNGIQSYIDIIQNFANKSLYNYNKDKGGPLKKGWNEVERFFEPVGDVLGEAGQQVWKLGMDAVGAFSMGLITDELTKSYMDQDATVFRLLETDDSNIKRTIKKYYLDVTEYAPEVLGNLLPDIALYALTGPGAFTTMAGHIRDAKAAYNLTKAAEGANFLNKLKVITGLTKGEEAIKTLGLTANKYKEIVNAAKNVSGAGKYYERIKILGQLLDRTVTEFGLGQFMDAQWSAFDTEPYSQSSFLMSAIGSVAFDILPSLTKLVTGKPLLNLISGESIWSLAKYIDSSEDAAKYIAAALRKGTGEIGVEELESFVKEFGTLEEAARQAYNQLSDAEKAKIGEMTKGLAYNYINQAFGSNSTMGKAVRKILENKNSNLADVVKYVARIPGDVSVGPYVSTIKLKNGTRVNVYASGNEGRYNAVLDSVLDGGFAKRIEEGFTQVDLDKLSKVDGYSNIEKNKSKRFDSVTTEGKGTTYYLNKDGLKHFGLKAENVTLESLGITLKEAENTREALTKIKGAKGVNISDRAVDNLAETGGYDEITSKVKEVLGC